MKNKIFSLILAVCLVLPSFVQSADFKDISNSNNQEAIQTLHNQNIINGYNDGTFRPNNQINRAEFTKIIINAVYDENEIKKCLSKNTQPSWSYAFFPDVKIGEWYAPYICMAHKNKIIKGYPNGTFQPSQNINYVEAAKIIYEAYGDEGMLSDGAENWFDKYMIDAEWKNIALLGTEYGKFLTRGEVSQFLVNYLQEKKKGFYAENYVEPIADYVGEINLINGQFVYSNTVFEIGITLPVEPKTTNHKIVSVADSVEMPFGQEIYVVEGKNDVENITISIYDQAGYKKMCAESHISTDLLPKFKNDEGWIVENVFYKKTAGDKILTIVTGEPENPEE